MNITQAESILDNFEYKYPSKLCVADFFGKTLDLYIRLFFIADDYLPGFLIILHYFILIVCFISTFNQIMIIRFSRCSCT